MKDTYCPQHPDEKEVWNRRRRCRVCPRCEEDILNHDAGDCPDDCRWCFEGNDRTSPGIKMMGWDE